MCNREFRVPICDSCRAVTGTSCCLFDAPRTLPCTSRSKHFKAAQVSAAIASPCSVEDSWDGGLILDSKDLLRHASVTTLVFVMLTMIEGPPFSLWKGPRWLPLVLIGFFLLLLVRCNDPYATKRRMKLLEEKRALERRKEQDAAAGNEKSHSDVIGSEGAVACVSCIALHCICSVCFLVLHSTCSCCLFPHKAGELLHKYGCEKER
jgi:hypothetical protein